MTWHDFKTHPPVEKPTRPIVVIYEEGHIIATLSDLCNVQKERIAIWCELRPLPPPFGPKVTPGPDPFEEFMSTTTCPNAIICKPAMRISWDASLTYVRSQQDPLSPEVKAKVDALCTLTGRNASQIISDLIHRVHGSFG